MRKKKTIVFVVHSIIIWIRVLQENRLHLEDHKVDILEIDLFDISFLEPCNIVSLSLLIEECYNQEAIINFIPPKKISVDSYLKNIRFYEYWQVGFQGNQFTLVKISTTLCLWKISQSMIDVYANEVKNYYQENYFQNKDLTGLHVSLTEVFNNIFDHSESKTDGYVLTQYYPNKLKIRTSICDFGIGIPNKINQKWVKCQ